MKGTVYLVGAGPGDPGLVTVRARELLRIADVVVYDRLIPMSLLDEARPDADLIDAGKTAGDHTMRQDEINDTLVRQALAGKTVVRVKGGDPFLFGRGGEEAAECRRNRIPFEIVPGVPSGLSVPAYAGIPVTHRGISDSVTLVTATPGASGNDGPDFEWLARATGTVVFFMGLRRVGELARSLIDNGAPISRPVAVISRGTDVRQRTVTGTLATIAERLQDAGLESPGLIVVGNVVNMREQLEWFERRPLYGVSVAVTRARPQASGLVTSLRELGAIVVECPTISIEAIDTPALDRELDTVGARDVVLFTSRNGVDIFFDRLADRRADARALGGVRVGAIGAATADALGARGIDPDVVPPPNARSGAGLAASLASEPLYGASVLIVRAEKGDNALVDGLREMGAKLEVLPVYRTVVNEPVAATMDAAVACDFVTFASASTVTNFARFMPPDTTPPPAITIGPVTTRAAREHAFDVVAEATEPSVASLVVALIGEVGRRPRHR